MYKVINKITFHLLIYLTLIQYFASIIRTKCKVVMDERKNFLNQTSINHPDYDIHVQREILIQAN